METLKDLYFNDKGFVFDSETGNIYSLNTAGAFIVKQLQSGTPVNRVLPEIRKRFNVDEATAQRDMREFLDLLAAFGLLTRSPSQ